MKGITTSGSEEVQADITWSPVHVFREVKGKKVKIRVCRRDGCGGELDK